MSYISPQLSQEWLAFADASLASRIKDAEQVTAKVLAAVQTIAGQLDDKQELDTLLSIKNEQALPSEILPLLQNVLDHLSAQDELSQLIAPLYTTLQFEDRTRQKLEGLLAMMAVWAEVRAQETLSDSELASKLMAHVVCAEQQSILAKYFPDDIPPEQPADEIEFF